KVSVQILRWLCPLLVIERARTHNAPYDSPYFTVNGADAVTFSHSTSSFPLAPPAPDSVMLRVSTGDDGLPMVSEARARSVTGSSVVAPSRMPSGDTPTPQMWRAPARVMGIRTVLGGRRGTCGPAMGV